MNEGLWFPEINFPIIVGQYFNLSHVLLLVVSFHFKPIQVVLL